MDPEDHFIQIYQAHGSTYHELIAVEDVDGNLRPALEAITAFEGKSILDLGTGTGRIPLLFPEAKISGLDLHRSMLLENQRQQGPPPAALVQADMRAIPFPPGSFEIITAGWALGHFTGWYQDQWETQAQAVLDEMHRVAVSSGHLIILETMTTGSHTPAPPSEGLAIYYQWLEKDWDFTRQAVQTDYLFPDLERAIHYTQFFFGDELAEQVRRNNWVRLPEWTGIWSKRL